MGGCCVVDCCVGDCCAFDTIKTILGGIFCSDSACGYTPGPSKTEQHAKKIAEELAQMKEDYNKSAGRTENDIMNYISASMNTFIEELSKINNTKYGDKELNIDIEYINRKTEEIKRQVVGHIGSVMEERLVQTDPQLSVILKEEDDKKRAKNFKKFCDDVFEEAVNSLRKPITDAIQAQQNVIESEINQRIKEVSASAETTMELLSSIQQQKEKGDSYCEETKIACMYKLGVLDCILDELE